jgi:hypothetical protein
MPTFVRGNPPPLRKQFCVAPVKSDFSIREETPAPPRFTRRALVSASVRAVAIEPEPIRPPPLARLMARR